MFADMRWPSGEIPYTLVTGGGPSEWTAARMRAFSSWRERAGCGEVSDIHSGVSGRGGEARSRGGPDDRGGGPRSRYQRGHAGKLGVEVPERASGRGIVECVRTGQIA